MNFILCYISFVLLGLFSLCTVDIMFFSIMLDYICTVLIFTVEGVEFIFDFSEKQNVYIPC